MIVRPLVLALLAGASNAFAPSFATRRSISSLNDEKSYLDDLSASSQPSDDKDDSGPEEESLKSEYLENMSVPDDAGSNISDEAPADVSNEAPSDVSDEAPDDVETPPDLEDMSVPDDAGSNISDEAPSDVSDEAPSDVSNEAPSDVSNGAPDDVETPPDVSSTKTPSETATAEKTIMTLLQIAASTGRGEFATQSQKDQAAHLIAALELKNPTSEPANSPMINGRWELLYSSTQLFRSSPFFMAGRAVCSTPEQAKQYDWFCDMHRKALAISSIGQVRQVVSPTKLVSEFEVQVGAIPFLSDFTPFAYSGGWPVAIEGAIVSSAEITPSANGGAWELYIDTVEIKGSNIPGLRQVLDQGFKLGSRQLGDFLESNVESYTNPRPVFETTYLSETIRISRDQDGKEFVYGKLSDDTEPSDYSGVESDLGALKLLEGFNDAITKFYL